MTPESIPGLTIPRALVEQALELDTARPVLRAVAEPAERAEEAGRELDLGAAA